MRIHEIRPSKITSDIKSEYGKSYKVSKKFIDAFDEELDQFHQDKLNGILSEIDNAAQKLKENLTLQDLINYKKLVKKFLQEATNGMLKYTKKEYVDLRGRKRIYYIVEKVNDKLEKLTEDFLKDSKRIELLRMIDDIRGLLIDIYS
ncbi:MAG TPA: YaaR family protein [Clostridia bacterium]|nr:YaaR family protein [Clostridia bacterium]